MRKLLGMVSILLGAALILSALFLYGYNKLEDRRSGDYASEVLSELRAQLPAGYEEMKGGETPSLKKGEELDPEMPVVTIDGYEYVGYIRIPALAVVLPVMTDWTYEKMRIAACRQFGSSRTDDLVIAAHNYDSFFGRLKDLPLGAEVIVTDMEGYVNTYSVEEIKTIEPTDVGAVQFSDYDLVLYTCTYGGASRIAAFCNRIEEED